MIHELKIYPEYFHSIINENKSFELRKNDRDYKVGDLLALNEVTIDGSDYSDYTGNSVLVEVTYILDLKDWLKDSEGYVILGIRKLWIKYKDCDRDIILGEPRGIQANTIKNLSKSYSDAFERIKERIIGKAPSDEGHYDSDAREDEYHDD